MCEAVTAAACTADASDTCYHIALRQALISAEILMSQLAITSDPKACMHPAVITARQAAFSLCEAAAHLGQSMPCSASQARPGRWQMP